MLSIFKNIQVRICEQGIFCTFLFYVLHMMDIMYGYGIFQRRIAIKWTSRISGTKYMKIGHNFSAGEYLWLSAIDIHYSHGVLKRFDPQIIIGNNVSVEDFVHIGCVNHIEIGDNVLMGSKIYITDHNHGIYNGETQSNPLTPPAGRSLDENKEVVIGSNTWIGEFVTILPGVHIGEGCIIGTHSVVSHDILPYSIAVGAPARVIKQFDFKNKKWVRV